MRSEPEEVANEAVEPAADHGAQAPEAVAEDVVPTAPDASAGALPRGLGASALEGARQLAMAAFVAPLRGRWWLPDPGFAPRGWLHWASLLAVLVVFSLYARSWVSGNWGMLTDPALQTDDARTVLFPFHRYGPEHALAADPIAHDMLALVPIGVWALYRLFVPLVDLFVAAKLVQLVCLAIGAWGSWLLARSRRGGVGVALLLMFWLLHDHFMVNRISGGLPRGFAFPCFVLWLAGVLGPSPLARRLAPLFAALTYPSAMLMLLAGESVLVLRSLASVRVRHWPRRVGAHVLLVGACFLATLPSMGGGDYGPIHTLAEAKKEPAFGKSGRLWLLPFDRAQVMFAESLADPAEPRGATLLPQLSVVKEHHDALAVALLAACLLLPLLRLSPEPRELLSVGIGISGLYFLSRAIAFKLYSPERYYSFGMRMVTLALVVTTVGMLGHGLLRRWRAPLRNFAAAAFMLAVWALLGNGVVSNNGMSITSRHDAPLWPYFASLPQTIRVACHPMDCDDIPLWSRRSTIGGFETLQPWFVTAWRRQRLRAEDTLNALYADKLEDVLAFAKKYGVSHFFLDTRRYGADYVRRSASFEPLSSYARGVAGRRRVEAMPLAAPPASAIVHRYGTWIVVDVKKLEAAGRQPTPAP